MISKSSRGRVAIIYAVWGIALIGALTYAHPETIWVGLILIGVLIPAIVVLRHRGLPRGCGVAWVGLVVTLGLGVSGDLHGVTEALLAAAFGLLWGTALWLLWAFPPLIVLTWTGDVRLPGQANEQ